MTTTAAAVRTAMGLSVMLAAVVALLAVSIVMPGSAGPTAWAVGPQQAAAQQRAAAAATEGAYLSGAAPVTPDGGAPGGTHAAVPGAGGADGWSDTSVHAGRRLEESVGLHSSALGLVWFMLILVAIAAVATVLVFMFFYVPPSIVTVMDRPMPAYKCPAPVQISVVQRSAQDIELSWVQPPIAQGVGKISSYNLRFECEHVSFYYNTRLDQPRFRMLGVTSKLVGLQIAAVLDEEEGHWSPATDVETQFVPGAPTNLNVCRAESHRIGLTWGPPVLDGGCAITGYVLCFQLAGDTQPRTIRIGNTTQYDLGSDPNAAELTHGMIVRNIHVRAENSVGWGAPSNTIAEAKAISSAACELGFDSHTQSSVRFSWDMNAAAAEKVKQFQVQYVDDAGQRQVIVVPKEQRAFAVENLRPAQAIHAVCVTPIMNDDELGLPSNVLDVISTSSVIPPPSNVQVTNITESEFTVSWSAPEVSNVERFVVSYFVNGAPRFENVPPEFRSTIIRGLPPGKRVACIQVAAVVEGNVGNGSPEQSVVMVTPDLTPKDFRIAQVTQTSATVTWQSPLLLNLVTRYHVSFELHGVIFVVDVPSSATTYTLGNAGSKALISGDRITNVSVSSVDDVGIDHMSAIIPEIVTHCVPPPVRNLAVSTVSPQTLGFTWSAPVLPATALPLFGYRVNFVAGDSESKIDLPSTSTSYVITGLQPGVEVPTVTVCAFNTLGSSPPVSIPGRRLPAAPAGLIVESVSGSSVIVAWDAPLEDGGSAVSCYEVRYVVDGTALSGRTATPVCNLKIQGPNNAPLPNGAEVNNITVHAVTVVGVGAGSNAITTVRTLSRPSEPTRVVLGWLNADNKVPVSWEMPAVTGGCDVSEYKVTYDKVTATGSTSEAVSVAGNRLGVELPLDAGVRLRNIMVTAVNTAGAGPAAGGLNVDVPSPVSHLSADAVSLHRMTLRWVVTASAGGSPTLHYLVKYHQGETGTPVEVDTQSADVFFVLGNGSGRPAVGDLPAGTKIRASVAAVNRVGQSQWSDWLDCETAPLAAPSNLVVRHSMPTSVTVHWGAPELADGRVPNGYEVSYTIGGEARTTLVRSTDTHEAVISGLHPGTKLEHVRVRATFADGSLGAWSLPLASVSSIKPPLAVSNVHVAKVGPASIVIEWTVDHESDPVTTFFVHYTVDGSAPALSRAPGSVCTCAIEELHHGARVTGISVVAENAAGQSPPATCAEEVRTHSAPTAPADVVLDFPEPTTLRLRWQPPSDTGGTIVQQYILECTVDGKPFSRSMAASDRGCQFQNLKPGVKFDNLVLRAQNAVGKGAASPPLSAQTAVPKPPTPGQVILRNALRSTQQLIVQWPKVQYRQKLASKVMAIVRYDVQWCPVVGLATALAAMSDGDSEEERKRNNHPAPTADRWELAQQLAVTPTTDDSTDQEIVTVKTLPNCSYYFRVRAVNTLGTAGEWSPLSAPMFLGNAIGARPTRRVVPDMEVSVTGGGYMVRTKDITTYINANIQADEEFDAAMMDWLHKQGREALRTWARRVNGLTTAERAVEAFRLTKSAPAGGAAPARPAKAPTTPKFGATRASDDHITPWVKASRAIWVPQAVAAASGRPSLLKLINQHKVPSAASGSSRNLLAGQPLTPGSKGKGANASFREAAASASAAAGGQ